jgi:hypothetical protein
MELMENLEPGSGAHERVLPDLVQRGSYLESVEDFKIIWGIYAKPSR